ncbi:uncharacterized protein LOC131903188 [Peromyscus eremicus]|uniref:uncharacterized protein LOC131903188 n=1 Tax=Peromyscus eremicus TaxID=42410 RepID=UPI0027DBB6EB|nr:uncharacterized protein LOC131903188 [Peromyscus eremicus]
MGVRVGGGRAGPLSQNQSLCLSLSLSLSLSVSLSFSPSSLSPWPPSPISSSPLPLFLSLSILSVSLFPSVSPPPSLDDYLFLLLFPSVAQTRTPLLLSSPHPPPASPYPSISPSSLAVLSLSLFLLLSLLSLDISLCVCLLNFLLLPVTASPKFFPPPPLFSVSGSLSLSDLLVSLRLPPSLDLSLFFLSFLLPLRPRSPTASLPPLIPLLSEAPPSLSSSPPPPSLLPPSLFQLRTLPSDTRTKLSPHLFFLKPDPLILTAQAPSYPPAPLPLTLHPHSSYASSSPSPLNQVGRLGPLLLGEGGAERIGKPRGVSGGRGAGSRGWTSLPSASES